MLLEQPAIRVCCLLLGLGQYQAWRTRRSGCNACILCALATEHLIPCYCMQVVSLLSLTLLEVHLVRRMLETAYMMQYPEDAKMHLIAYVFGLRYECLTMILCAAGKTRMNSLTLPAATTWFYHCRVSRLLS